MRGILHFGKDGYSHDGLPMACLDTDAQSGKDWLLTGHPHTTTRHAGPHRVEMGLGGNGLRLDL